MKNNKVDMQERVLVATCLYNRTTSRSYLCHLLENKREEAGLYPLIKNIILRIGEMKTLTLIITFILKL